MYDRVAVHLDHIQQALRFHRMKFSVLAEARVVDQQIDLDALFRRESKNLLRGVRIGEVRGEYFGSDFVGCG
jgi:hypothetical protein